MWTPMRTSLRVRFCSEAFGWWEAQAAMWANKCIEWLPSCSRGLVRSREGLRLAQCRTVTAPQRPRFVARTRANFNAAYGAAVLGRVPRLQSIGLLRAMSTRASPPLSAEARDEGAGGGATSSAGPLHVYRAMVESGEVREDARQLGALEKLQRLHDALVAHDNRPDDWLASLGLRQPPPPPRGKRFTSKPAWARTPSRWLWPFAWDMGVY